jgi:SAM-dependent methyltransferase
VKTKISKILTKILGSRVSPEDVFLSFHYQRINQRRQEHLATLGLEIAGTTVLEVGAGIGDHTSFFLDRGCHVVTSDGREENIKILRSRYPHIEVLLLDLDNPPGSFDETFDIVYCYGLLYHLSKPAQALEFLSGRCRKILLLETSVSPENENAVNLVTEDEENPSQSVGGTGCRPTRRWVYNQLSKHFEYVYLPLTQPNHEEFPTEWSSASSNQALTRAVFIATREQIDNELMCQAIPTKQVRH